MEVGTFVRHDGWEEWAKGRGSDQIELKINEIQNDSNECWTVDMSLVFIDLVSPS